MSYQWDFAAVFRHSDLLISGAKNTFLLFGSAVALALPIGLVTAVLRLARIPVLSWIAVLYTEIFRTAPSIVLIFWFFFALPILTGIDFSTYTAVTLALGLQTGAYMAEVFRAGILGIAPGQWQAARAIGMGHGNVLRYVILPQAIRRMLPVFFVRLTELFKTTSLAAAVSYAELLQTAQRTASDTFRPIETFTIVAAFFFVIIFLASRLAEFAERRLLLPS